MSSPADGAGAPPDKDKKGLGKVLSRIKTILRRGDSSKRLSTMSTSAAGPSTTAPATAAAPESSTSAKAPAETSKHEAPKTKKHQAEGPEVKRIPRAQIYEERARKLGERFGLDIKPSEWHSMEGDALRVERPIRMRVHRRCHVCQTPFGHARACPSCQHARCKDCARYPPHRTEEERLKSRKNRAAILKEREANAPIVPDWDASRSKKIVLTRPGRTEGRDLVHRKPRQRVRRTCHQCHTVFKSSVKTCEKCEHIRCTDCPRDPPKKTKYPYGYPGDEYGENATPLIQCHECHKAFPPNSSEAAECISCRHTKCDSCPRLKPQKVEPEPDPEVLRSVQEKLAQLQVHA